MRLAAGRPRMSSGAIAVLAAGGLMLGAMGTADAASDPSVSPRDDIVSIDQPLTEVPNAVAVANDGTIAASLYDAQSIALVKGPEDVVYVPVSCSPADVAIHPDATLAWAVCPGDPHLRIVDVPSGTFSVASLDMRHGDDVVYLPGPDRLVIADLEGEIILTTGHDGYQVLERVSTGAFRPTTLAPLADGSRTYAATELGRLISVDFARDTVTALAGQGGEISLWSVALSRQGTSLYATAFDISVDPPSALVLRLDPVTGRIVQRLPLVLSPPGGTGLALAAGHRSLSLATGNPIDIGGQSTGTFNIALDARGAMGALSPLAPMSSTGSDVSRSAEGQRAAFATTNSSVAGVLLPADQPYSASVTAKGGLAKGVITLSGTTTGLQPGTQLTVHVKDATKKASLPVTQPVQAVVDARGAYTWKGKVPSKRVQVFVTGPLCASPKITLVAK